MIDLPDLIAATADNAEWTWDVCVCCGSPQVAHRGLYISDLGGGWKAARVGWCTAEVCEDDRQAASGKTIAIDAAATP